MEQDFELLDQQTKNLHSHPASIAHLLGDLGPLAQQLWACLFMGQMKAIPQGKEMLMVVKAFWNFKV